MKIVDIEQNTPEWHALRANRLGASDSNIIMNQGKKITPLMLWKEKALGEKIDNSGAEFIFAKGHRIERKLRNIAEMLFDTDLPSIVAISDEYEFLLASMDGYSSSLSATWECKYCGQDDYDKVAEGEMLMHYYPQVQHQLMLSGAQYCIFMVATDNKESEKDSSFPYKYAYIKVEPDINYMKNELLPALVEFQQMVENKIRPDVGDKDIVNLDDNEPLIELLAEYQQCKIQLEQVENKEKSLQKDIYKILGKAKKVICNGVKITQSKSADKVVADIDSYIFEITGIEDKKELEKEVLNKMFTKIVKGRITKRITFPKEKK